VLTSPFPLIVAGHDDSEKRSQAEIPPPVLVPAQVGRDLALPEVSKASTSTAISTVNVATGGAGSGPGYDPEIDPEVERRLRIKLDMM
jgi:hypothetical protein